MEWGNAADWAGVALTAIGVLIGGAGGVYIGARSRMRMEIRRRIFDELLTAFTVPLWHKQKWILSPVLGLDDVADDYGEKVLFGYAWVLLQLGSELTLLPWRDRAYSKRMTDCLGGEPDDWAQLEIQRRLNDPMSKAAVNPDVIAAIGRVRASLESMTESDLETLGRRANQFGNYLRRQLNPTFADRLWFNRVDSIRLWVRGPRPLAVRPKPER